VQAVRAVKVAGAAWKYLLRALEDPSRMPHTLRAVAGGAHPGHYFTLDAPWFRQAGIRTVLDVGAHKGEFSSAIRALLPRARIYAFEPLPDCCAALSGKMSNGGRFQAFPVAIGKTHEQITLWRSRYAKSSSVLPMAALHKDFFPWSAENTPLSVEQRALDEYLGQLQLDDKVLLKIDVQGYEAQVLRGATETLKRVTCILLEVSFGPLYEGQGTFAEIHGLLQAAGFSYSGNLEQLCSPVDGSILQADALFCRNGVMSGCP
jgi:FkbM family methyltransferase